LEFSDLNCNPKFIDALLNRANTSYELKEYFRTIHDLEKVMEFKPDTSVTYFTLGLTYTKMREFGKALDAFERSAKLTDSKQEKQKTELAINHAIVQFYLKNFDQAKTELQKVAKLNDQEGPSTQQKSKVIILISDGEDFGEHTNTIVKDIEDKEIKLFTLGVGTSKGGQIRTGNGFKTDHNGNKVVSKLNSGELRKLAADTGGEYFEINESRNDVSRLINTINRIEGEMRDARFVDVSANRYFYFLLAALLLLAVDILIQVKTVHI